MATPRNPRVVVVGAGVGGLVSALLLAAQGCQVTVLERAATPGGKMRRVLVGDDMHAGLAMDAGPTVFTMRWVFDSLFDALGETLADHLTLTPLHVLARHAWDPGQQHGQQQGQRHHQRLDLFADLQPSADAIGAFAGPQEARGYLDFCTRARSIYNALEQPFLCDSRPNPLSLVSRAGLRGLPGLLRISPMSTLWQQLGRHFADPRLQQLFGRYATYCGSSPYLAPATLMLVAHVEQQGVWRVQGGMHRVVQALVALAQARGVMLRCNAAVDRVLLRDGRACGVRLSAMPGGPPAEELPADAVVFNGDVAALAGGLLGDGVQRAVPPARPERRSLSALTWNLRSSTSGFPLSHHTVFFSNDYAAEFDDLQHGRLPGRPTAYVCAQDRAGDADGSLIDNDGDNDGDTTTSPTQAHGGAAPAERLLVIVNAPPRGDTHTFGAEELAACEAQTFGLMQRCGLHVQRTPERTLLTAPQDFEHLFPATGGALYGQASHGWLASFQRPGARSRIPGLYLAGGSVHPGPGVPMAALSGMQAARSVLADRPRLHAHGATEGSAAHAAEAADKPDASAST